MSDEIVGRYFAEPEQWAEKDYAARTKRAEAEVAAGRLSEAEKNRRIAASRVSAPRVGVELELRANATFEMRFSIYEPRLNNHTVQESSGRWRLQGHKLALEVDRVGTIVLKLSNSTVHLSYAGIAIELRKQ